MACPCPGGRAAVSGAEGWSWAGEKEKKRRDGGWDRNKGHRQDLGVWCGEWEWGRQRGKQSQKARLEGAGSRGKHSSSLTFEQRVSAISASFFFFFWPLCMWDLSSPIRYPLSPLHWELGVLITGPPGKSLLLYLMNLCWFHSSTFRGKCFYVS